MFWFVAVGFGVAWHERFRSGAFATWLVAVVLLADLRLKSPVADLFRGLCCSSLHQAVPQLGCNQFDNQPEDFALCCAACTKMQALVVLAADICMDAVWQCE